MSDPNLDLVEPTNNVTTYENCDDASPTLDTIQWEPDGRTIEQAEPDLIPFSIVLEL